MAKWQCYGIYTASKNLGEFEADPKELGGNEAAREAKLNDLTSEGRAVVDKQSRLMTAARQDTERARLTTERLKLHVRLHEVAVMKGEYPCQ